MRRGRLIVAAATALASAVPAAELYAACTYTPAMGGEIRHCTNGTCWSSSLWRNNQLVEVIDRGCNSGAKA